MYPFDRSLIGNKSDTRVMISVFQVRSIPKQMQNLLGVLAQRRHAQHFFRIFFAKLQFLVQYRTHLILNLNTFEFNLFLIFDNIMYEIMYPNAIRDNDYAQHFFVLFSYNVDLFFRKLEGSTMRLILVEKVKKQKSNKLRCIFCCSG